MSEETIPARSNPGESMSVADEPSVLGGQTTSLACYLRNGTDEKWQWGLNNDNSWYKLNGSWHTTPYTKLTKFLTDTSENEIIGAAKNAIRYYEMAGYEVVAVVAADKKAGYNYPIVVGDKELFPKY